MVESDCFTIVTTFTERERLFLGMLEPETQHRCEKVLQIAYLLNHPLYLVCTQRTPAQQNVMYAQGRTKPGRIVTQGKAGYSWHNFNRAFDVAFLVGPDRLSWDGPWEVIGQVGKWLGLSWGGDWKAQDMGHFEYPGGLTLAAMRKKMAMPD